MIYQSTSIREVIARIVRNTRVQDTSYILAMDEWIPEAMGIMNLRQSTSPHWIDLDMQFHKQRLPVDTHHITAVEYNGRNLLASNYSKTISATPFWTDRKEESKRNFISVPQTYNVDHQDGSHGQIYDSTTVPLGSGSADHCNRLPGCGEEWYQVDMGFITTSFSAGRIRVHYKRIAVDEDGLPLIPDNENFKQALYYYVRYMMNGAGWKDKAFKLEELYQKFEFAAARAVAEITYPTDAELELAVRNSCVMLKDERYFDRFFETPDHDFRREDTALIDYSKSAREVPNQPVAEDLTFPPGTPVVGEIPSGLINNINTFFITAHKYVPLTVEVFLNGIRQAGGLHYTLNGTTGITFAAAPQSSLPDIILVNYTIAS